MPLDRRQQPNHQRHLNWAGEHYKWKPEIPEHLGKVAASIELHRPLFHHKFHHIMRQTIQSAIHVGNLANVAQAIVRFQCHQVNKLHP